MNNYDIIIRKNKIMKMAKYQVPEEYQSDDKNKYKTESERYQAVKKEIENCSKIERDNLEILLKCKYESYKRLYSIEKFGSFGIALLNISLTFSVLVVNIIGISHTSNGLDLHEGLDLSGSIYSLAFILIAMLLISLISRNYAARKQSQIMYVLEVLKKCPEISEEK